MAVFTPPPAPSIRYIPSLDGVRAIAIIMVVLVHANYLSFGWIGVQIFFVLSGYLVSAVLLRSTEAHPDDSLLQHLKRFYWNRCLRIFPIYFTPLILATIAWLIFGGPPGFGEQQKYLYTFTYNIYRIIPHAGTGIPIEHLWSISAEEQFYLIWPFLFFLLPRTILARVVFSLVFIVPLLRMAFAWFVIQYLGWGLYPDRISEIEYQLTIFQLDAFAMGAALNFVNFSASFTAHCIRRFWIVLLIACYASLLNNGDWPNLHYDLFTFHGFCRDLCPPVMHYRYQYLAGFSVLNLLAALLIFSIIKGRDAIPFLDHPIVTYIGKISYGLYIFHAPIQVWTFRLLSIPDEKVGHGEATFPFIIYIVVLLGFSSLSYHFFEKRFLRLKSG